MESSKKESIGIFAALLLTIVPAVSVRAAVIQKDYYYGCEKGQICDNDIEPLGCFDQGPETPWCHMYNLPQYIKYIQPKFYLLLPGGGGQPEEQIIDFFDLTNSVRSLKGFDPTRELFTIVHGFGPGWPRGFMYPMAYELNNQGINALIVRWDKGSGTPDYFQAASDTRIMGAAVARVLTVIAEQWKTPTGHMTIAGFSLGAHIAGFAGARLPGLRRIFDFKDPLMQTNHNMNTSLTFEGLDPAGPLYAKDDPFYMGMNSVSRLNFTDANLVVCIHTDGLPLNQGGAGTVEAMGDIDFYVNGGQIQPGCGPPIPQAIGDIFKFDWAAVWPELICPHSRSDWVMITSIANALDSDQCKFKAFPCRSTEDYLAGKCTKCGPEGCPNAGFEIDFGGPPYRGKYYFSTNKDNSTDALLCGRQYLLSLQTDVYMKGSLNLTIGGDKYIGDDTPVQDINTGIKRHTTTSFIVVGYFDEVPSYVAVKYVKNNNIFSGAPSKFNIISLTLSELNGIRRYASPVPKVEVETGVQAIVPLQ